ncbi:Cyanovirin-N [Staphylotrichum tortipilum]|uniref:Cyanovirin-N n=1 Tax=Staphylotrichum tortipilum TaxID=2831512 RepID=A0AAN6M866_9PEZI|nr:Cyanovirin-N [Staphylotrichum longicolle]
MGNFCNFHESAENIRMEESHILSADLRDPHDNKLNHTTLDLNHCIGNVNGKLKWGGKNFSMSAKNVHLTLEGPDSMPMLHAQLMNEKGMETSAELDLPEHIGNRDGNFLVEPKYMNDI